MTATNYAPPLSPASCLSTAGIGDPTYADAILDRLVHNAHRLDFTAKASDAVASRRADNPAVDMWTMCQSTSAHQPKGLALAHMPTAPTAPELLQPIKKVDRPKPPVPHHRPEVLVPGRDTIPVVRRNSG